MLMNMSEEPVAFTFRLSLTVAKKHISVTLCHQHAKHTFRNKFFGNLPEMIMEHSNKYLFSVGYIQPTINPTHQ
jgi:hypothetical protein